MKKRRGPRVASGIRNTRTEKYGNKQPPKPAMAPARKNGEVVFYSRHKNLELVLKAANAQVVDGVVIPIAGKYARFAPRGKFITSDPSVIAKLRGSKVFGVDFYEATDQKVLDALIKKGVLSENKGIVSGVGNTKTGGAQPKPAPVDPDEEALPPGNPESEIEDTDSPI